MLQLFFYILFVSIVILVFGLAQILLLRQLNRVWWDKKWVRRSAYTLPLIGIGGISTAEDVVEFLLCGARAVQIGTALFVQPDCPVKITKDLKNYLKKKQLSSVSELVGRVRKY